ncbi:MAG: aldolase, partial [Eubacteriales bacterium]
IVMLPYFKTKVEVQKFIEYVDGRVKTCLLLETPEAAENVDTILSVQGIDYIHVGLNDLHLGYNMKFMFELLANGTVELLFNKIKEKGIPYGFGGIAQLGKGTLPAENIIAEHYRLGSSGVILSRSFCDVNKVEEKVKLSLIFKSGVSDIRDYEKELLNKNNCFFNKNKDYVWKKVMEIIGDEKY